MEVTKGGDPPFQFSTSWDPVTGSDCDFLTHAQLVLNRVWESIWALSGKPFFEEFYERVPSI